MRAPSCPAQRGGRGVLRPPPQLLLGTSLPLRVTPPPFCAALPTFCFSAPLYSPGAGRWHGGSSRQKRAPGAGLASGPPCPPGTHSWKRGYRRSKACPPLHPMRRARLHLHFLITPGAPAPCTLLPEDQPHRPGSPASQIPTAHLGSWAIREMEAKRLAVAAAGQGAVGLRSRGGKRGCTKRLARKASGWRQEKRGSGERIER